MVIALFKYLFTDIENFFILRVSLRGPNNKIGNVFYGEVYAVLEISEDGQWMRIDVPELDPENGGWVSAEYVVLGE